jgi:phosphoheptose isomerase
MVQQDQVDFEDIDNKFRHLVQTDEYYSLVGKVNKAKKIYFIGNGGLHFVASHAATDMTRLVPDKVVYSFDSVGFITSNANDHGYNNLFVRWLETVTKVDREEEVLVIGLSCSGNSANVINALEWSNQRGFETYLISGEKSNILPVGVPELSIHAKYFHTVEVACMMIFYDLVYKTGNRCPTIRAEKERLKDSDLRKMT